MATLAENLAELLAVKQDMKNALIEKHSAPTGGLNTYAEAIRQIVTDGAVTTEIRDLHIINVDDLTNLSIGQSVEGVLVHSNTTSGYILGYDNSSTIAYKESGFRTQAKIALCANECITNDNYVFEITKESNPSAETLTKTFSVTGANFTTRNNYQNYTDYYITIAGTGTINNISITFDGHYPQDIYFGASDGNKGRGEFLDSDGNVLAISRGNLSTSDNSQFTKYTMNENMTIQLRFTRSSGNPTGYFYIRVPSSVTESVSLAGEYSIRSKQHQKYLNIDQSGNVSWSSTKFNVTLENFNGTVSRVAIAQPDNTNPEDLIVIKSISSQNYLSSTGASNFSAKSDIDDTCIWAIYTL